MTKDDREKLLALVSEAFADVPPPEIGAGLRLADFRECVGWGFGRFADNAGSEDVKARAEKLQARDASDRCWADLPDWEIEGLWDGLRWLSPPAFRFYYPAYLSYTIRHSDAPLTMAHQAIDQFWHRPDLISEFTARETEAVAAALIELGAEDAG